MGKDLLWKFKPGREQKAGPVNGVKTENILTDDMDISRPKPVKNLLVLSKTDSRQIVRQGVEPDIDDMPVIVRNGDSPTETDAADGKIPKTSLYESDHFVSSALRLYEIQLFSEEAKKLFLVIRHAEKIAF